MNSFAHAPSAAAARTPAQRSSPARTASGRRSAPSVARDPGELGHEGGVERALAEQPAEQVGHPQRDEERVGHRPGAGQRRRSGCRGRKPEDAGWPWSSHRRSTMERSIYSSRNWTGHERGDRLRSAWSRPPAARRRRRRPAIRAPPPAPPAPARSRPPPPRRRPWQAPPRPAPPPARGRPRSGNCGSPGRCRSAAGRPGPTDPPPSPLRPPSRHREPPKLRQAARDQCGPRVLAQARRPSRPRPPCAIDVLRRPTRPAPPPGRRCRTTGTPRLPEQARISHARNPRIRTPPPREAAGSPVATSCAKFGPVSTAAGTPGCAALAISNGKRSVPASTPLAQTSNGTPGRIPASTARRCCTGAASRIASTPSPGNALANSIPSGNANPGKCRLTRPSSGVRAQRLVCRPARCACNASAVPHAPAPTTATLLIGDPQHRVPGPGLPQPLPQRRENAVRLALEPERRRAHDEARSR